MKRLHGVFLGKWESAGAGGSRRQGKQEQKEAGLGAVGRQQKWKAMGVGGKGAGGIRSGW